MRKVFQSHIFTENNSYSKNSDQEKYISKRVRPITTNIRTNKENPIKLYNKRAMNSNFDKYNYKNSTNYSFFNRQYKSYDKHHLLNKNKKNLSEGELNMKSSQNILPLISQTEPNIETKLNKKKLEDIIKMFKSEPENQSFLLKKLKFKHRGLNPGIPNDLLSRLKYIYKIFKNKKFIQYVDDAPPRKNNDIEGIADYLWKFSRNHSIIEKSYALIFNYLCNNIHYDVDKINEKENNIERVFRSGYANSLQFCKLFEAMCRKHSLKTIRIEGFCKTMESPNYKKGTDVTKVNHYWNCININNNWYFCDVTLGSGTIKPKSEKSNFNDNFNPYYFLTPADYLIITHRPLNDLWQMTEKTVPANEFSNKGDINMGDFYKQVYEHQVDLISHKTPIIKCTNKKLELKLGIRSSSVQAFLYYSNFKTKSTEIKTEYDKKTNIVSIEHTFNANGEYWLEILYREEHSDDIEYLPLIKYKIIANNSDEKFLQNLKMKKKLN